MCQNPPIAGRLFEFGDHSFERVQPAYHAIHIGAKAHAAIVIIAPAVDTPAVGVDIELNETFTSENMTQVDHSKGDVMTAKKIHVFAVKA